MEGTVKLNVGGIVREVFAKTLQRFPNTKLGQAAELQKHYRASNGDYFFDRDPAVFREVLNYYRTGRLHVPNDVCISIFQEEMEYWGISVVDMSDCCWLKYSAHFSTCSSLENIKPRSEPSYSKVDSRPEGTGRRLQRAVWKVLDDPRSSKSAKVYAGFSVVIILLSLFVFVAMSHPAFKVPMTHKDYADYYQVSKAQIAVDWGLEYFKNSEPHLLDEYLEYLEFFNHINAENHTDDHHDTERRRKREASHETDLKNHLSVEIDSQTMLGKHMQMIQFHEDAIERIENSIAHGKLSRKRREADGENENGTATNRNATDTYTRNSSLLPTHPALVYIDLVCFGFFVFDFLVRLIFCPSFKHFIMSTLNWIDLLVNLAYTVELILEAVYPKQRYHTNALDLITGLQILRIFRIFRLFRYSKGLRVLTLTVRHSWREILLLSLFLGTGVLFFASLIFFTDGAVFTTMTDACWWAIVTMTTVGYGDYAPKSFAGRIVGTLCAIAGVMTIAFTVPVIVNNFMLFYQFLSSDREHNNINQISPMGNDDKKKKENGLDVYSI